MSNIKFSFVIPNKNQSTLLEKCVDSIPQRDDVEIIIVDDASDPDFIDFENYPASQDPRVKVLLISKEETKGVGNARNIGMSAATGKWIVFSDSDDFYETENLNIFLNKYIDSDYDIVYYGIQHVKFAEDGNDSFIKYSTICQYIKNYCTEVNEETDADLRYATWSPCSKMIRLEFLRENNITFPCFVAGEDTIFSLNAGHFAKNIQAEDVVLYNYVIRPGSISRSWSEKKCDDQFEVILRHHELCKEYGYEKYNYPIIMNIFRAAYKCSFKKIPQYLGICCRRKMNPFKGLFSYFLSSKKQVLS